MSLGVIVDYENAGFNNDHILNASPNTLGMMGEENPCFCEG